MTEPLLDPGEGSVARRGGVSPFAAATRGVPVVITGFRGHLDYLSDSNAFFVGHELVAVDDPAGQRSYTSDQTWGETLLELLQDLAVD